MGLKTRVSNLKVLPPGLIGHLLPFQITFPEVLRRIPPEPMTCEERGERPLPKALPPLFIGETVSRIFAPIYVREGTIFDGLEEKPIGRGEGEALQTMLRLGEQGRDVRSIRFLPMPCPYCGADLHGEKDTWVLVCRNCDRVYEQEGEGLTSIEFGVWPTDGEDPYYFLPFWRIPVPPEVPLFRARPHPSPVRPGPNSIPAPKGDPERHLWLPAFKLSPSLFLNVSRAVTTRRPTGYRLEKTLPKGRYYPVNLPRQEAAQSALVLLAELQKGEIPSWEEVYPQRRRPLALLVFIPFRLQRTELVQEMLSLDVSRFALHFGRFI
jgi:hypothetical protein